MNKVLIEWSKVTFKINKTFIIYIISLFLVHFHRYFLCFFWLLFHSLSLFSNFRFNFLFFCFRYMLWFTSILCSSSLERWYYSKFLINNKRIMTIFAIWKSPKKRESKKKEEERRRRRRERERERERNLTLVFVYLNNRIDSLRYSDSVFLREMRSTQNTPLLIEDS